MPDARRVFAVFEQPDLKASFTFTVNVPEGWTVLSNSPTPSPTHQDGTRTFAFAPTEPISSYITAIVAGPYRGATDEYRAPDGRVSRWASTAAPRWPSTWTPTRSWR